MAKLVLKNDHQAEQEFKKFHSWYKKIGGEIPLKETENVMERFKDEKIIFGGSMIGKIKKP